MLRIVTIGGGTGSFINLRGLKRYPFSISAIVTTFDSGGSSGVLRDEYGILPPGDIRRCLVALADEEAEPTLRDLFNYRFDKDGSLQGHSFGNLFLTALTQISGDYPEAVARAARILNCKGDIYPVSLSTAHLCAELRDGQIITGETNIDIPQHDPSVAIKRVFLTPTVAVYEKAKAAILAADAVIIGPGDLYTSLIPNLLVEGMQEALQQSTAKKIYVCNLMTKYGETHDYQASDFAKTVLTYAGLSTFDTIICNNQSIPEAKLALYAKENKYPVVVDEGVKDLAAQVIMADLLSDATILHYDSDKVAKVITGTLAA